LRGNPVVFDRRYFVAWPVYRENRVARVNSRRIDRSAVDVDNLEVIADADVLGDFDGLGEE
jgi:hypothetical protein